MQCVHNTTMMTTNVCTCTCTCTRTCTHMIQHHSLSSPVPPSRDLYSLPHYPGLLARWQPLEGQCWPPAAYPCSPAHPPQKPEHLHHQTCPHYSQRGRRVMWARPFWWDWWLLWWMLPGEDLLLPWGVYSWLLWAERLLDLVFCSPKPSYIVYMSQIHLHMSKMSMMAFMRAYMFAYCLCTNDSN